MAPDADGTMRKIPEDARTEPGWALARVGDGGWWPAIERGLRAGRLDDEIVVALADILRGAGTPVAWVTSVPSARLGDVCAGLAERLAGELGVEHLALIARTEARPPQREMANAVQQAANVRGAFTITARPTARDRRPARRPAHLRLDARDGRRPAAASRRARPSCRSRLRRCRRAPAASQLPSLLVPRHLHQPAQRVDQPHLLRIPAADVQQLRAATSTARHRAREIATLRRLRLNRNSRLRGSSAPLDVAIEKNTTAASWPWNLSTVPTRTPSGRRSRRQRTWAL